MSPTSANAARGAAERLDLSIVMPGYNEAANIRAGVLSQIAAFLRSRGGSFEILFVDDGSVDGSVDLVRAFSAVEPSVRAVATHHGGKAHALVTGLRAARGRIVLCSDIDQAIPIPEAAKLIPWFDEGFDIVVGSRGMERKHATLSRRAISYAQLAARVAILGFGDITDTQCGFKAFRGDVIVPLVDRLAVYADAADRRVEGPRLSPGFDVEILYVARKIGLSIKEVPVTVDHRRRGPKTSLVRDCVGGVSDLLAIRAADRRGRYG